eukprot:CAMPEP_0176442676 /NCGR_PEP_ID=MMETSP0127-20121128/21965_1 /TAXON_ID=938130 /ORGANISM="Platyophrya macrostoma, Strain WH" /LENGTH=338 /DNA_ID=CAMNT_0017827751 /DNA_START=248 /DNA_END=1264 /DNA_ORIENTATION=+
MAVSPAFKQAHDEEEQAAIKEGLKTEGVWWKAAFPALCDISGTGLQLVAMNFMSQSVFVMLRGGSPVIIAILTVVFLKRVLLRSQILGLSCVVVGVTVVGINTFIYSDTSKNPNLVVGVICCFLSMFGSGVQGIVEEKILRVNHIHPLKLVGFEGFFGLMFNVIVLVITSFIPCDVNNVQACNINGMMEDVPGAIKGIFGHGILFMWVILSMVSLGLTNYFAMTVTKVASALTRVVLSITILVIIWAYNLIFNGEIFYVLQFVGFMILIVGNLIYQKIIKIPGIDKANVKVSAKGSKAVKSFGHAGPVDPVPHLLVEEDPEDTHTDDSALMNNTTHNY